jgi:hypothetical protein
MWVFDLPLRDAPAQLDHALKLVDDQTHWPALRLRARKRLKAVQRLGQEHRLVLLAPGTTQFCAPGPVGEAVIQLRPQAREKTPRLLTGPFHAPFQVLRRAGHNPGYQQVEGRIALRVQAQHDCRLRSQAVRRGLQN